MEKEELGRPAPSQFLLQTELSRPAPSLFPYKLRYPFHLLVYCLCILSYPVQLLAYSSAD